MSDADVKAIAAAVDAYYDANVNGTTHEFLLKQGVITVEAPDWLRDLLAERERLVEALTKIANHELDKRYWSDISDHAIAQDCETAHDDLVATAKAGLTGE